MSRTELPPTSLARALVAALWVVASGACVDAPPAPDSPQPSSPPRAPEQRWSSQELRTLRSLWIARLGRPPRDPSNRVANSPRAARLGHRLFFDARLSRDGSVSCATCHEPERYFTDGRARSRGLGTTRRGAPTVVGTAYGPWFYWDGRRDSQWAQALTPLEAPEEMGATRTDLVRFVAGDAAYRAAYEEIFGALPDVFDLDRFPPRAGPRGTATERARWQAMELADRRAINRAFANLGKSLAAYQRKLVPGMSRFDRYVASLVRPLPDEGPLLGSDEIAGLRLFVSPRAQCLRCHNGPLFTNHGFHNIGLPPVEGGEPDRGRRDGIPEVLTDPFNCRGAYSDADPDQCRELNHIKTAGVELPGAFKVPSLRSVSQTSPYMHSGQLETLRDVLHHYSAPPLEPLGHQELSPMGFTSKEMRQLEAFLRALDSPVAAQPRWLAPPEPLTSAAKP